MRLEESMASNKIFNIIAAALTFFGCNGIKIESKDSSTKPPTTVNPPGFTPISSEPPGPPTILYPNAKRDYPEGFNLTVDQFASCTQLQADIRNQFVTKQENDRARKAYYESLKAERNHEPMVANNSAEDSAGASEGADQADSSSDADDSFTNVQESGVDESDTFKIGASHIYTLNGPNLVVTGRQDLNILGKIKIEDLSNLRLFTDSNRLIVLGVKSEPQSICYDKLSSVSIVTGEEKSVERQLINECFTLNKVKTVVKIYQGSENEMPSIIHERVSDGGYRDSRFVNGHLIFVTPTQLPYKIDKQKIIDQCGESSYCYQNQYSQRYNSYSYGYYYLTSSPIDYYPNRYYGDLFGIDEDIPEEVVEINDGKINGVPCHQIGKPFAGDLDARMTKVSSINTRETSLETKTVATLGGGEQIYMTATGLYISKMGISWQPWVHPHEQDQNTRTLWRKRSETLIVSKVNFDKEDGSLAVSAVGSVQGRIKDQWAFKEYAESGVLAIATTTWSPIQDTGSSGQRNHLWILKQEAEELKLLSAIQDFGPNEDIRSVRYLDSIAYVVTYHKTDPLFAFDLESPEDPKILGELKVPGFSMYMHPLSESKLIGVGFDADERGDFSYFQGIQVSLFDTENKANMERVDNKVIGHRGSYSDVTGDHKAFFINQESSMIAIPVVELSGAGEGQGSGYATNLEFSGSIFYKIEDNKINEFARISHDDLIPEKCKEELARAGWWTEKRRSLDINRIFKVDDRILTLSRFGIKSYTTEDLTFLKTVNFELPNDDIDCLSY